MRGEVGPVLVAGSTLEGEEAMLLETFRQVAARYPRALLVLAPRHPERFEPVASLLAASGIRYRRRSQWDGQTLTGGTIFLLDSIGELASFYEFADLAFIGGSLVPRGGHNVLEAAQFGAPILVGPHTENFRDIIDIFRQADALRVVTPQSLTSTVLQLLEDRDERERRSAVALPKCCALSKAQPSGRSTRCWSCCLNRRVPPSRFPRRSRREATLRAVRRCGPPTK